MIDWMLRAELADDELAIEFLDHPERFEPTDHALVMIYDRAYSLPSDWLCISKDARAAMAKERLRVGHISNHRIEIQWGYSSTAGRDCPILANLARCMIGDGRGGVQWREIRDGGIAFVTSEFIQRKYAECDI